MNVGSTKETSPEKRISITPDTSKSFLNLGLKVLIEKGYGASLGYDDSDYKNNGAEVLNSPDEVLSKSDLICKVNFPTEKEMELFKENSNLIVSNYNPDKDKKFLKNKFKTKVLSCSTVRDKNNLALSSRNILLNNKDIKKSSFIANLLIKFKKRIQKNISNKKELNNIINKINNIKKIKVEYLEIRNKKNLSKNYKKNNFKIFLAYYNKKVRLIDNY